MNKDSCNHYADNKSCVGPTSSVLPEASCHAKMESSQTGVVNGEKMYKLVHELSCLKVQY